MGSSILKLEIVCFHKVVFLFHGGLPARPRHHRTATEEMGPASLFGDVSIHQIEGGSMVFRPGSGGSLVASMADNMSSSKTRIPSPLAIAC